MYLKDYDTGERTGYVLSDRPKFQPSVMLSSLTAQILSFNFHKMKILHLREMVLLMETSFSDKAIARLISIEQVSKFSVEYRNCQF